MPDFLKIRKNLSHYSFHISFFLLIAAFLTWFQPLNFKSFFNSSGLKNLTIIKWLTSNETTLFNAYIIFCCVEFCVLILAIISYALHAFYSNEISQIFPGMLLLNSWFMLLIFILGNLGVFQNKINDLLLYLEDSPNQLRAMFVLIPCLLNIPLYFSIVYGFFFHGASHNPL